MRVLAALLLLPLLLFLGGLAAMFALLPDQATLKARIATVVERDTGRSLSIAGPITASLFPRATVSLADVRLANLPGGTRPDMARAERISFTVALWPLLHHRVVVEKLLLVGPNILFEQVGGQPNWLFHRDAPHSGPSPYALRFREVEVRNGMTTFRFPPRVRVIGIRSLVLRHPRDDGPLSLRSVLVYRDFQAFRLDADAAPSAPGPDAPWHSTLFLSAMGATAHADGDIALDGHYALALTLDAPELERVNALLPEMDLPPLHDFSAAIHVANGAAPGDLPVVGSTRLHVGSADLSAIAPGLRVRNVSVDLPDTGGTAVAHGEASWRRRDASFDASLHVPARLDGLTRSAVSVSARLSAPRGDRFGLDGMLALRDFSAFAGFDGHVRASIAAASAFRDLLPALPPLTGVSVASGLAVPAARDAIRLDDARFDSGQGDATGSLRLGLRPPYPASAQLRSSRLDLDGLLPASKPGAFSLDTPLPWAKLRGPDLALDWQVDRLHWHGIDWPALHPVLTLQGGSLRLAFPDGALRGELRADAGPAVPPVSLRLDTPALPLAPFSPLLASPGAIAGAATLSARLSARGTTPAALLASLDGPFAISVLDASIDDAAILRLAGPAIKLLGSKMPGSGRVPIRCFGVSGRFEAGQGRLPMIALSTPVLTLSGEGRVDLAHASLAADTIALKLHPLATLLGSKVSVPVVVEGPLTAPKGRLDADGLDKIGIALDALFGGDHPHVCRRAGLLPDDATP